MGSAIFDTKVHFETTDKGLVYSVVCELSWVSDYMHTKIVCLPADGYPFQY